MAFHVSIIIISNFSFRFSADGTFEDKQTDGGPKKAKQKKGSISPFRAKEIAR